MAEAMRWLKSERETLRKDYRYNLYSLINIISSAIENKLNDESTETLSSLAQKSKINQNRLVQIINGTTDMTLEEIAKLSYYLKINLTVRYK